MRVEGVYTYICESCYTFFAVVSRFSVKTDRVESLNCPKCLKASRIVGEGHIQHEMTLNKSETIEINDEKAAETLPAVLKAEHIAEYLQVSKRVVYELMDQKDFPLIRIRRSKFVNREEFFQWLSKQNS